MLVPSACVLLGALAVWKLAPEEGRWLALVAAVLGPVPLAATDAVRSARLRSRTKMRYKGLTDAWVPSTKDQTSSALMLVYGFIMGAVFQTAIVVIGGA